MNEIIKGIKERRSVRSFREEMPKKEDLEAIVEAGLYAASGMNRQAPVILVITDKAIRDELSKDNAAIMGTESDPFYGAPAILVVLSKKEVPTYVYDGALVMGNMMLAAHSLGLGSVWIHRAKEEFETDKWKDFLKKQGLEGEYEGIGHCVVGYPAADVPKDKERAAGRVFWVE